MTAGVRQNLGYLEMLEERARPSVGEHQREGVGPGTDDPHGMDGLPADVDRPVLQPVDPPLKHASIAGGPLAKQIVEPTGWDAALPAVSESDRAPSGQASAQLLECILVEDRLEADRCDFPGHEPKPRDGMRRVSAVCRSRSRVSGLCYRDQTSGSPE